MPGGFPTYLQQPNKSSGQSGGTISETETTTTRSSDRPAPLRSILKPTKATKAHDPLAARFYRVQRPEPISHTLTYPDVTYGHDNSWHSSDNYDSPDFESGWERDTDSQSATSELSINTQATSVLSDDTITDHGKLCTQVKQVRHVPPPTVAHVKARPKSCASTEVTRSPPQKKQVNIHIFPSGPQPTSQELQLSRKAEKDLIDKIDELELETGSLRDARVQLNRELSEMAEKLSFKVHEANDLQWTVNQERGAKDMLLRELQQQRLMLDEFRQNYELQRAKFEDSEKDRDNLKLTRDSLKKDVSQLKKDIVSKESQHKELETLLVRRATEIEEKVNTKNNELKKLSDDYSALKEQLEKQKSAHADEVRKLASEKDFLTKDLKAQRTQMKQLKDIVAERDSLRKESELNRKQVKVLGEEKNGPIGDKETLKEKQDKLQGRLKEVEGEKGRLQTQVTGLQGDIKGLKADIESFKAQSLEFESTKKSLEEQVQTEKDSSTALVEAEKKQADDAKTELQATIEHLTTELEGAKDANVVIVAERLDMSTKLDAARATLAGAEAEAKDLAARNTALAADLDAARARTTELEATAAELVTLCTAHDALAARADGLQADLDQRAGADAARAAQQAQLAEEQAAVASLRARPEDGSAVAELNADKARLAAQVAELETQAEALRGDAARLQGEVDGLRAEVGKVPALTEQHAAAAAELEQLRVHGETLAGQVRDLTALLTKMQARSKSQSRSGNKKYERSRSTTGLLFVRNALDRTGVTITTREALKAGEKEKQ
jgi:chromosome segregation ATPase